MNNLLNIKTPAESVAQTRKADYNLSNQGIGNLRLAYWNLPTEALVEEAIFRSEGAIAAGGAFVANTGKHTARSANDKFVVRHTDSEGNIWWGVYNRPFAEDKFEVLYDRMLGFLQGTRRLRAGRLRRRGRSYRLPVRIVTELAWHSHFVRNMFILPQSLDEYKRFVPEFTIVAMPSFKGAPSVDNTASETFICLSFEKKLAIIGNTAYAGEIKKSVFTILNYLLPLEGVLSMHCSANVNPQNADDVALFFGLSGTGKTTLSADPTRRLIGDDEHGWSDSGVFNIEGGCYAKVIGLSESAEPEIYATTHRFGTILENVPFDPVTRLIDLDDDTLTENTRASYPLEFIANAMPDKKAGHPKNVILLTCDASGVMPPIARLTPEPGVVPVHLGLHIQDRRHGSRARQGAGDHVQRVLRRTVHGASSLQVCGAAQEQDRALRRDVLAGQHRLGGRSVRRRQAHLHQVHACVAERRAQWKTGQGQVHQGSDLWIRGPRAVSRRARRGLESRDVMGRQEGVRRAGTRTWRCGSSRTSASSRMGRRKRWWRRVRTCRAAGTGSP